MKREKVRRIFAGLFLITVISSQIAMPVPVYASGEETNLGPVTSKDVIYQIITDRFYDGDTSNNVPELGSWNVDQCTEALLNPGYPEWYLPVSVPADSTIEFKFIKKDANGNVTWESGSNHVLDTSEDSCGVINTDTYSWQ